MRQPTSPEHARNSRAELLLEINNAVVSNLDLQDLLKAVAECLLKTLPQISGSALSVYNAETDQLHVHALALLRPGFLSEGLLLPRETPGGMAFATQKRVLTNKLTVEEFPADLIKGAIASGLKTVCAVPLTIQERRLGVLSIASQEEAAFSADEVELFTGICRQIAIAVDNSLNFQQAEHERDRLEMLLEISSTVSSTLDFRDLLKRCSAILRRHIKHDFAGMAFYEEDKQMFRLLSLDNPPDYIEEGDLFPMEGTPDGLAFKTRQIVLGEKIDANKFPSDIIKRAVQEGYKSGCVVPMISRDRVIGTIAIGSKREASITQADGELLQLIANQIAGAVDNVRNYQLAKRERDRFEMSLNVSKAVSVTLALEDLLKTTSAVLRRHINHDFAGMALYEEDKQMFRIMSLDSPQPPFAEEGFLIPMEGTPDGLAFKTRQIVLRQKLDTNEFPSPMVKQAYQEGYRSGCVVPLISRDRVIGSLAIASKRESSLTPADGEIMQLIANQIAGSIENALQYAEIEKLKNKLASEKLYLEEEIQSEYNFAEIVGQSAALKQVLRQIETVAPTDSCVLICGETGTGKELIARAIHNLSNRRERTMVKLNCAAIPTGLLESELFGHEKGAFTGAVAQRIGRFELANKGTLLLDEIGDIPLELQPKLLRVLQESEFERLGSSRTVRIDVRMVAATNCDLQAMVEEKQFRSDLYYRLNVFPIKIPPLRERRDDIPLLAGYFTQKHARRMNKRIEAISKESIDCLCKYDYPGNVRELENFIERAVILTRGNELNVPLNELKTTHPTNGNDTTAKPFALEDVERAHIAEVLAQTRGVVGGKGGAAEILGLPISTLRHRMKKLGLR